MRKLFLFLLFCSPVSAATYTALGCSTAQVQAAITAEGVSPANGDIIAIPACALTTWTAGISWTPSVNVTIQGAGAVSATTGGASTTGTDNTQILYHVAGGASAFSIITTSGKSFRFTGIALIEDGSSPFTSNGMLGLGGTSASVRVDHNHFHLAVGGTTVAVGVGGHVLGVADHDYIDGPGILTNDFDFINGDGWDGNPLNDNGDGSWSETEHWGTSQFFYVEDTLFSGTDLGDAHEGGRYVIRYCTATGTNAVQMYNHGASGPSRGRATRAAEVYNNNFNNTANNSNPPYSLNSGTLLYWGNTVTGGYQNAVRIAYDFRTTVNGGGNYYYPNNWKFCGNSVPNTPPGNAPWDGNIDVTGQPCFAQPGRGKGDLLAPVGSTWYPHWQANFNFNCCGWGVGSLITDFNLHTQKILVAGTSGGSTPAFSTSGGTVVDGGVTWQDQGLTNWNSLTGIPSYDHEALSPIYTWSNTYTPAFYTGTPAISLAGDAQPWVQFNRDVYRQFGPNDEPGTFNGTKGVGTGTLIPTNSSAYTGAPNCTAGTDVATGLSAPGVGYFDTANQTLYVCNPTNTWTAYYTPYTYPHPLTGGITTCANPTITPGSEIFFNTFNASISAVCTSIIYTTNGTTPTASGVCAAVNGTLYTVPVSISTTTTLSAIACQSGSTTSGVTIANYTLSTPAPAVNMLMGSLWLNPVEGK